MTSQAPLLRLENITKNFGAIVTLTPCIWMRGLAVAISGGRPAQDLAPSFRVTGGVGLKGGVGRLPGVYAGVLLLSSIYTAINLMGLPAHYTQVILGALVLAAVLLDAVKLSIKQRPA